MGYCLPGSSVHGLSQVRILEWVDISFSRGFSQPRDGTSVSCIGRWILYHWTTWKPLFYLAPLCNVEQVICFCLCYWALLQRCFLGSSDSKASYYNVGDLGLIPGLGKSPGEGYDNPLQYSCLENPMDQGAWWATVHGVARSRTRLSDFTSLHIQWHYLIFPWGHCLLYGQKSF